MRTLAQNRNVSPCLDDKPHLANYPSSGTAELSDLLQIRRCKLNSFCSIAEEQPNEMELEHVSGHLLQDTGMGNDNTRLLKDTDNASGHSNINADSAVLNNENSVSGRLISDFYNENTSGVRRYVSENANTMSWNSPGQPFCQDTLSHHSTFSTTASVTSTLEDSSFSYEKQQHQEQQQQQQQHETVLNRNHSEIKSGLLVIVVDQTLGSVFQNAKSSDCDSPRTIPSSRCPVIVKIHRKSYEHYAIISLTRRRQATPSFFLRLKRSHATQSASNPSRFAVILDDAEGKSLTFEATDPESAANWIKAFSSDSSYYQKGFPYHRRINRSPESPCSLNSSGESSIEDSPETLRRSLPSPNIPSPSIKLRRSPFMPVLSESFDEEEEKEE